MNCRHAIYLAAVECDGELPSRQLRSLHLHLARCPACSERRRELANLDASLRSAAQRHDLDLQPAFADALHARLAAEQRSREDTPVARLAAHLEHTAHWCPALPRLATLFAATAMLSLALWLLLVPFAPPGRGLSVQDSHTTHLASFSIQATQDGLLHARLIDRSAPLRLRQRRDTP
jgi:anti-sigma factor RsiW